MYFLFSFWPLFAMGQVYTGFESGLGGEWNQFPENRWESSPEQALSGLYSLHHSFDNTVSGTDKISFKAGYFDTEKDISWDFSLRHGYLPSSSNNWKVYLASDKGATQTGSPDGYVFGVNITGSDDSLRLYSSQSSQLKLICSTKINFETDIGTSSFHCFIKRDSTGRWEIFASKSGSELRRIGSATESGIKLPVLEHFIISYSYTSAKDRLFWFDELQVDANFITHW